MILERVATGGCQSYLIGCTDSHAAILIDPVLGTEDLFFGLAAQHGMGIKYIVETHTHADHFSAALPLAKAHHLPIAMHINAPARHADLRLEDGQALIAGQLRLKAIHTPGHTADSMCLYVDGHVFTGDTLLFGGTGRTDLPSGDADQLYDSLFGKLLTLPGETEIHPAHDYKGGQHSTIANEIATNPRLQKRERQAFVTMMHELNLSMPTHITEALRTNMHGGKTIQALLADAGHAVPFVGLDQLAAWVAGRANDIVILDVREKEAFTAGHIPGAIHIPRGQLELRVNEALPDPTARILTVCEFGKISTLAAATLRELGFIRAAALDGGMKAWKDAGHPVE
jgi:glyoxylase-like metal-dependent hydrolase (beta-lactamase superfamily II)/rhodanese-related sulfurtransferase